MTPSMLAPSRADTINEFTSRVPVSRRCKARSGMTVMSSLSLPIADWPLEASIPITSQEKLPTRSGLPNGDSRPNNCLRIVSPITHTASPARCSPSVNTRPPANRQLATSKYAAVLPVMLVAQLLAPYTTVEARVATGATPLRPSICAWIASASASLKRGAAEPSRIGPSCWPGRTRAAGRDAR